ncbi:hypothetical protein GHO29_12420 [Pseudomonas helleri]|uniref:Integron protein cassette protein n=1 Tax=Pseudomonas helleri TaxID=1608996 RepID=A0A7X2CDC9_9PSED|nr:hypothetical protein [Pseudomonas helleri]MQU27290.1 hypothetical protein [Pseudomonas helleri]
MRSAALIFLLFSLLTGCASKPTPEQIQAADYGASVYQADAEKAVKSFFNIYLKDPESARYSFGSVYRGYMVGSVFEGRKLEAGYLLDVTVNAKNSYGGYVGAKPYKFLIHNDRLVGGWEIGSSGIPIKVM